LADPDFALPMVSSLMRNTHLRSRMEETAQARPQEDDAQQQTTAAGPWPIWQVPTG
jgi:hypothetical protein